jgi:hypothetical protein
VLNLAIEPVLDQYFADPEGMRCRFGDLFRVDPENLLLRIHSAHRHVYWASETLLRSHV